MSIEWISVEDRLPEVYKDVLTFKNGKYEVLCIYEEHIYEEGQYHHTESGWTDDTDTVDEGIWEITHWMPLPEPPNAD